MEAGTFLDKGAPVWEELDALLRRARRQGARRLTAEELARLDKLYRQTAVHLALVRSRTSNEEVARRLDQLVARAHSYLYVAPERGRLDRVAKFYLAGFPRLVARTFRFHLVAAVLLLAGAGLAWLAANQDTLVTYLLLGGGEIRLPGSSPGQLQTVLRLGRDQAAGEKLLFASFLFTHNTRVGLLAFASGVLCAVPTVFILLANGAMLGAFARMHHEAGLAAEMWAWVLPHGIAELGAIVLCGGAGLMLGFSVLHPGWRGRGQSLADAGRRAVRIALGVVPMFIVAGFIESFVRQSQLTTPQRLAVAAFTLLVLMFYFGSGALAEGRDRAEARETGAAPGPSVVNG